MRPSTTLIALLSVAQRFAPLRAAPAQGLELSAGDVTGALLAADEPCAEDESACSVSFRQLRGRRQGDLAHTPGRPSEGDIELPGAPAETGSSANSSDGANSTAGLDGGRVLDGDEGGADGADAAGEDAGAGGQASNRSSPARAASEEAGRAAFGRANASIAGANASGGPSANASGAGSANASGSAGASANATANATANASANATANASREEAEQDLPLWTSPRLYKASTAPLHSFYMYRAVSGEVYPPLSVNTASLGGVLWYLHNEVVHHSPRKFNISKVIRLRVQTRATQPLFEKGMNFGVRLAFDSGQATGPLVCNRIGQRFELCGTAYNASFVEGAHRSSHAKAFEWDAYGYFVGCNNLGSFPFPMTPTQYPGAAWYSLPGPCPSRTFRERDAACDAAQPGGLCEGTPTGSGNCTWNYKLAGEVSLDELVGIPDYAAFLASGRREYVQATDRGYGFTWWDSKKDRLANLWRMQKLDALFAAKYPDLPRDSDVPPPPCDFSYSRFYQDPGFYSGACRTARRGDRCFRDAVYAKHRGVHRHPDWYPGLSAASSLREFQGFLHRTGPTKGPCALPCDDVAKRCHTAVRGERCWKDVRFAMGRGIHAHPEWYAGLALGASFEDFQSYLYETGKAKACTTEPCAAAAAP